MFGRNSAIYFGGIICLLFLFACASQRYKSTPTSPSDKIHFDLSQLNEEGLLGPPDGLRSISYEFCIPADENRVEEVTSIDSTLRIYYKAPGKIGCSDEEYLCIGDTHQSDCREVLVKLASLEYIEKIEQSFFE